MAEAAHAKLTNRTDFWWLKPLLILIGLILGFGYLTWAAFQNAHYIAGPYISPVYASPYVPDWWKISPAFILLWIPAGFRVTCYYGRKMYYRALLMDPPNCAVEEPHRKNYKGESSIPLIWMNIHRYFLYFALALTALHWYEFIASMTYEGQFYLGLGTAILLIDTLALSLYVFSCHSLRHIFGGKKGSFSKCGGCPKIGYKAWSKISFINAIHGFWFWVSLFSIAAADLYIRLLAMGIISNDPHITF